MKIKPHFNSKQRAILQLLNKSRAGLSLYEISQETGISWITVKKYVQEFTKKNIVIQIRNEA